MTEEQFIVVSSLLMFALICGVGMHLHLVGS